MISACKMTNMRRIEISYLTTLALLFIYSCDTTESSFDESIPDLSTLSLASSPEDGGALSPSEREFVEGEEVEIEALPSEGFLLEKWEGDYEGDENPANLVMDDDKSVIAHFREISTLINIKTSCEGEVLTEFDTVRRMDLQQVGGLFDRKREPGNTIFG